MRILHTADWHLGKIVNEFSMIEDQRYYLHQLIDTIKEMNVDVIIMAGDLYDRSLPPKEAVSLADEILTRMITELKVPVLAIAGNHDSNERLEFGSRLFTENQLYMEGTIKPTIRKVQIEQTNFYLVPFGDPIYIREVYQNPDIRTMEDVARYQVASIKKDMNPDECNILIGHSYVISGTADSVEASDSERPLSIGTAEYIPVEVFEDFDYVALGHLHKPQKVKKESIRYSGSILKYSKSECRHKKQVTLVDIDKNHLEITPLYIQPKRDMRTLRGAFDDLMKGTSNDYLFFELEDSGIIMDSMNRLRHRYPNAMGLEYVNHLEKQFTSLTHTQADLKKYSLPDLFKEFYSEHTNSLLDEQDDTIIYDAFSAAERNSK
ncbi:exonuclease SbcCD subunit D [Jeotgalibaca sp. MA1X17-3]|uniref:exonuclease SbcCD subunit D n=1 Tax=Jeotgalibaca sp. MA1X17-3 TaxID=2908211 RepID=UPI001F277B95|nr:exonuclease SbcCD subunit D [Jeotgalibaca sp. MA1X17-3]UJF16406.1 exonuclease SbcCD subunit D [Jeotgalibaca sp. MA1X17-3]